MTKMPCTPLCTPRHVLRKITLAALCALPLLAPLAHADDALSAAASSASSFASQATQAAQAASQFLGGDEKLACEALLCLPALAARPAECGAAIARYFAITGKNMAKGRFDFLSLCPTSSATPEMQELTRALVSGAGRCDVDNLNASKTWVQSPNPTGYDDQILAVSNKMPSACGAFYGNSIIGSSSNEAEFPKYVGEPKFGGYWVAEKDYPAALADYNQQREAYEAAERGRAQTNGFNRLNINGHRDRN